MPVADQEIGWEPKKNAIFPPDTMLPAFAEQILFRLRDDRRGID